MADYKYFCGYLWLELPNGAFTRKFFELVSDISQLLYYDHRYIKVTSSNIPDGAFDTRFLSLASDASSYRPKVLNCFYIIVSGNKYFMKADSEQEKNTWIKTLLQESKIQVTKIHTIPERDAVSGHINEVVAGVVIKSNMDDHSIKGIGRIKKTAQPQGSKVIKEGYCTKQGFTYSKGTEDIPIRTILLKDVVEVRPSIGIHPSRKYVLEVVTRERVFYMQAQTPEECEQWLRAINMCLQDIHGPKSLETGTQTKNPL